MNLRTWMPLSFVPSRNGQARALLLITPKDGIGRGDEQPDEQCRGHGAHADPARGAAAPDVRECPRATAAAGCAHPLRFGAARNRPGDGNPRQARAAQLAASLELGRRTQLSGEKRPRLRTPAEIYQHLAPAFRSLRKEVFHVLSFNARNVLLNDSRVAEGSMNACPVDPREVFCAALGARATAIVLAHNHPSGDPEPSEVDIALTEQLAEGGRILGIRVLDHLVVAAGGFVSLLERGRRSGRSVVRAGWAAPR